MKAQESRVRIVPLRDDVLERHPFWGVKHLGFIDLKGWLLHKSIKRQLKVRSEVWGVGLWPDARLEATAKKIARIFEEQYAMPACFIPDDPFSLIAGYRDDLDPVEARQAIEEELQCLIPDDVFVKEPDMTYRRFVEIVLGCQGNDSHKKKKQKFTAGDWVQAGIGILVFLGFVAGVLFLLWKVVWFVIGMFK